MNNKWFTTNVVLKYMLGDLILFKRNLILKVLPPDIISEFKPPSNIMSPTINLADKEAGYLMRCTPLTSKQPTYYSDNNFIYYTADKFNRYYIDLQQSFEEYKTKFSSKTRSTIRRKIKKFASKCEGKMQWKSYQTVDELNQFYHSAREVSRNSYQEKLLDSGLPDTDLFCRKMIDLAKNGQVRGYLLFDGDRPVAYMYCPIEDKVLLYQYLGYDSDYVKWSVGTILHWYAFEDIFSEGKFKYFDFTEGQSEHKRLYSTGSLLCGNVYIFPKNTGAWLLVHSHHSMNVFSSALGNIFEQLGLKSKLKSLIRFRKL